jgi:hypothetical protein
MTDPNPRTSQPGDSPVAPARKRPKHLLDPANPRPPTPARSGMSLTNVQQWIMSTLAVSTILHFSAGLVLAAFYVGDDRLDAQIGLLVIAGLFGVLSVAAGAGIHRRPLLSWWLLLGWIPTVVGVYLLFWR